MKSYVFLLAILIGIFLPQAHWLTFLIQYNLFVMLFYAFLNMRISRELISVAPFKILLVNLLLPFVIFFAFRQMNPTVALAGFLMALTPTAAAAPVITGFLRGQVAFVTTGVLINSIAVAILIPFVLPQMVAVSQPIAAANVMLPVALLIFVPLLLGQLICRKAPTLHRWLNRGKDIPFYLFVSNVFIASAKASHFIRHDAAADLTIILQIAAITLLVCVLNFALGHWLGRPRFALEGSMSLGRKNTMFAVWLALSFIDPLTALAPMFYILFQNLYNSWQLIRLPRIVEQAT